MEINVIIHAEASTWVDNTKQSVIVVNLDAKGVTVDQVNELAKKALEAARQVN